jgi:hypothetical protein
VAHRLDSDDIAIQIVQRLSQLTARLAEYPPIFTAGCPVVRVALGFHMLQNVLIDLGVG